MRGRISGVALVAALCAALVGGLALLPVAGADAESSGAVVPAARFVSKKYGYAFVLPRGWLGFPASSAFPGGDIDHTASYVDAFSAPDTREAFALGERTSKTLGSFARATAPGWSRTAPVGRPAR